MKKIGYIILFLFLVPTLGWSQTIVYPGTGIPSGLNSFKGGLRIDSALVIPHTSGVNNFYGMYGDLRINKITGNLEFHKAGVWIELAQTTGGSNYEVKEYPGFPVGTTYSYTLPHPPINGTITVQVNGVSLDDSNVSINGSDINIINLWYQLDATDKIRISYSYH